MSDFVRPTGLLLPEDHPASAAAYSDPRNWPMTLLMEGVPFRTPPPEFLVAGVRPNALDQNGVGACVAFSGTLIKDIQERADQGAWLYDTKSAFLAYDRLKHGWGSWPGDGIPDTEGSFPQAFWEMARTVGVEDRNQKVWKIAAWYSHRFETQADIEFVQQVLMAFGAVSVGTPWPGNWFAEPSAANDYRMPVPGGPNGAHAYTLIGWKTDTATGTIYGTFMNSWGPWGSAQGIFRYPLEWMFRSPLGPQIVHKIIDYDDVPDPPAPPPPGGDIVKAYDSVPRTFNCAVGVQFYRQDGVTPLVKLSSGGVGLYSPCKWDSANYNVVVSTGGVRQIAVVRAADVTNVKPYGDSTAAVAAERKRWLDWHALYPK